MASARSAASGCCLDSSSGASATPVALGIAPVSWKKAVLMAVHGRAAIAFAVARTAAAMLKLAQKRSLAAMHRHAARALAVP